MKNVSFLVLKAMFFLYFLGVGAASVVYNWKYAHESSLGKWIFFSEVVSLSKGLAWPADLWTFVFQDEQPSQSNSSIQLTDDDYLKLDATLKLRSQAVKLLSPPKGAGQTYSVDEEITRSSLALMNESLRIGNEIPLEKLKLMHPDLPKKFHSEFLKGVKMFIEAYEEQSLEKLIKSQTLMDSFGDWFNKEFLKLD